MNPSETHPWLASAAVPHLRPAAAPAGKRIAVIAPHPDDEVLGCGGTLALAKAADAATAVSVIYLTNGERGTPDSTLSLDDAARMRCEEGRRGLAALGLDGAEHAAFPDGALGTGPREVECVARFLREHLPEIVMVPAPLDPHADHRAAAALLVRVLEQDETLRPAVWLYEVQPCFPMNALVRIDEVEPLKARALSEHRSQGERLKQAGLGLAACRALYAPPAWKHAEAFRICSGTNFLALARTLGLE